MPRCGALGDPVGARRATPGGMKCAKLRYCPQSSVVSRVQDRTAMVGGWPRRVTGRGDTRVRRSLSAERGLEHGTTARVSRVAVPYADSLVAPARPASDPRVRQRAYALPACALCAVAAGSGTSDAARPQPTATLPVGCVVPSGRVSSRLDPLCLSSYVETRAACGVYVQIVNLLDSHIFCPRARSDSSTFQTPRRPREDTPRGGVTRSPASEIQQ